MNDLLSIGDFDHRSAVGTGDQSILLESLCDLTARTFASRLRSNEVEAAQSAGLKRCLLVV